MRGVLLVVGGGCTPSDDIRGGLIRNLTLTARCMTRVGCGWSSVECEKLVRCKRIPLCCALILGSTLEFEQFVRRIAAR